MARFTQALFLAALCLSSTLATADDKSKDKPSVRVEFRRAEKEAAEGLTEATVAGSKDKVYLHKMSEVTNEDIASVKASEDVNKHSSISITLTKDGAAKLKKLTEEHRDKPLAILVDGKVISAPLIKSVISDGKAEITGKFTKEEVEKLVNGISGK